MHEAHMAGAVDRLAAAICGLSAALDNLTGLTRLEHGLQGLEQKVDTMAQRLQDWADEQDADLSAISATLNGVAAAIVKLDQQITELQNSPDAVTPADQKRLDAVQATTRQLRAMADAIRVNAEDGQQPPTPPNS